MASVTDRNSKKHRQFGLVEGEAPEPAISEESLLVKRLAQKQFSKATSLTEQLNVKQTFVSSSSDLQAISEFPSGTSSLANFSANAGHLDLKGFLISHGLDDEDLDFFFDVRKGREFLKQKYAKIHPFALDKKISALFFKIRNGSSNINQYNCNSEKSRFNSTFYPPSHPINQLNEIENSLFGCKSKEQEVEVQSKGRKIKRGREEIISYLPEGCSQWDQKKAKKYKTVAPPKLEPVLKSCAPQTWYAIKDGKCVFLGKQPPPIEKQPELDKNEKIVLGVPFVAPNQSTLVSLDVIRSGRMSDDEIRCLPKFENYDRGLPTSTLFLKNLSHGVEENDLVRIFGNYEEDGCPAIVYRLMGGRMKGQAFISFSSLEKALAVLEDVNGFQLKGKPIIIQFGNKKS